MADNISRPGFRWSVQGNSGKSLPEPSEAYAATGVDFSVNGTSADFAINIGDPITLLSTGYIDVCEGYEASGNTALRVYGIFQGCRYWDGEKMTIAQRLPSNVAWGTNEDRKSVVLYVPAECGTWEVECDENTTAATLAAYRALIGENCDHTLAGYSEAALRLNPRLDISQHVTTTAQWRIKNISPTVHNQDFTGNYVKLLVVVNESFSPFTDDDGI